MLESEPSRLRQEVLGLRPDDAAFGFASDRDTSPPSEFENAVVSKHPERPQHGIAVDSQDGGHVAGGRQSLAGTDIAAGDVPANLCGHLLMKWHGVVPIDLDSKHGDKHSVIIVSGTETALKEDRRSPTSSTMPWSSAKRDVVSAGAGSPLAPAS